MRGSLTMGTSGPFYLLIASFFCSFVLFHGAVHAFFPTDWRENLVGLGGTSHVSMTRDVINHILQDADGYFPGEITTLTTFMIQARNAIADADSDVDSNEDHDSAAHFDAENFGGGQDRLVAQ